MTTSGGPLSGTFVYVFDATTSAYVGAATMGPGAAYSINRRRRAATRPTSRPTRRPIPTSGTAGRASQTATTIAVSANTTQDLLLASPPTFTLSGNVTTSGGPLSGTFVYVFDATTSAYVGAATMGPGAAYSINVPAGSYKAYIQTNTPAYPDQWYGGSSFETRHHDRRQRQHHPGSPAGQSADVHPVGQRDDQRRPAQRDLRVRLRRDHLGLRRGGHHGPRRGLQHQRPGGQLQGLHPDQHAGLSRPVVRRVELPDGHHDRGQRQHHPGSPAGQSAHVHPVGQRDDQRRPAQRDLRVRLRRDHLGLRRGGHHGPRRGLRINVPAGNYKAYIQTNTPAYPDQWYGGSSFADGHHDRRHRQHHPGSPLASPPTFTLSGNVTTSGGPLSGTFVYVFDATTSAYVGAATMGPGAAYSINVPSGSYKAYIQTNTPAYPDQWYGGSSFQTATTIAVTANTTRDLLLASPPSSSLRGWWKMDGDLTDSSGLANHASLSAVRARPSWPGRSVRRSRSTGSQYASVPDDDNSLDLTTGMTLAAWIRPGTAATQDLIKKATNGAINGYELALASPTSPAGQKVFVRLNQVASGDTYRVNSTTTYPTDGTWIHVAATYDGTTIKLYINGVQEGANLAGPVGGIVTNTLAVGLGAQSDDTRRFTGLLDDARVYGSALSASEIAALAANAEPPTRRPSTARPTGPPGSAPHRRSASACPIPTPTR